MAKKETTSEEAVPLTTYSFPELGITVDAPDLETANKMAQKHPDVIYKNEPKPEPAPTTESDE